MIKECPILINSTISTVVKYDDIEIQFPKVNGNVKSVFVKYSNNKFTIVNRQEYETEMAEQMVNKTDHKTEVKKTTKREHKIVKKEIDT